MWRAYLASAAPLARPPQQSLSLPSTLCLLTPVRLSQSLRQTIPNSSLHQQAPETAPRLLTCGATPSFLRRPTVPLCPKQAGASWEGMMTPLRSDQASHRASLGGLPHVHPQAAPQTAFLADCGAARYTDLSRLVQLARGDPRALGSASSVCLSNIKSAPAGLDAKHSCLTPASGMCSSCRPRLQSHEAGVQSG